MSDAMPEFTPRPHAIDRVLARVAGERWAVEEEFGLLMAAVLTRRSTDFEAARAAAAYYQGQPERQGATSGGGVALIPVHGALLPRANMMSELSGAASYDDLREDVETALNDNAVSTIVLDVDSPGGATSGAEEFATFLHAARQRKTIWALAHYRMLSAAYWIGAQAHEVIAAPSAMVGSVGVFTMHTDLSKAMEQEGIKQTYVARGDYKVEGNPSEPLSAEARAHMTRVVDDRYKVFVRDLARGRGVTESAVRDGYGQGRALPAADALALGMIDRIGTLEETLARAQRATSPARPLYAASGATAECSALVRELQREGLQAELSALKERRI